MLETAKRLSIATVCAVLAVSVVLPGGTSVEARGPSGARYCSATDQVFWFVQVSDTHIGTSGSTDTANLGWLVTTARAAIKPLFTVVTGDLTDSTNGNIFGYPNGPYQAEWDAYRGIVTAAGVTTDDYYDLPGNHDAYSDRYFTYYRNNAVQGGVYAADGQVAWTKTLSGIGTYHFLGVNTADNTGAAFSVLSPYGDHAGLDATELTRVASDLAASALAADLTFVFGHHPVSSTGDSADTYLYYGASEFVGHLDGFGASAYQYGHVHDNVETVFTGDAYTGAMSGTGIRYSRVASLGKDSPNSYSVVSVDCNGVNAVTQPVGTWPLVLITAPVNRYVGSALNPYAYDVPAVAANPVRALVFDTGAVGQVRFRIDSGTTWYPMGRVAGTASQWAGTWDASALPIGPHSIEVQAVGTTTRSHTIGVTVAAAGNLAPLATGDAYTTAYTTTLTVGAPGVLSNDMDPDGSALTARLVAGPSRGTLTLNGNGGFTYVPTGNVTGTDTFTYTAWDGALASSPATVTITLTAPADSVAITSAAYTRKTGTLAVAATSSGAPAAKLTLVGYGQMGYNTKTRRYTYSAKTSPAPASVAVPVDPWRLGQQDSDDEVTAGASGLRPFSGLLRARRLEATPRRSRARPSIAYRKSRLAQAQPPRPPPWHSGSWSSRRRRPRSCRCGGPARHGMLEQLGVALDKRGNVRAGDSIHRWLTARP